MMSSHLRKFYYRMKLYRTFNDSSIVWALFKIQLTPKEIIRFWRMEQNQFKMNQFGSKFTETSTTSKLDSRKKLGFIIALLK